MVQLLLAVVSQLFLEFEAETVDLFQHFKSVTSVLARFGMKINHTIL